MGYILAISPEYSIEAKPGITCRGFGREPPSIYTWPNMFNPFFVPPNPFASRVRWAPKEEDKPEPVIQPDNPPMRPATESAEAMRAPIVETKKKYQKRRLPGERLLRRVARIAPKAEETAADDSDLDDATIANIHGALGDIVERMRL